MADLSHWINVAETDTTDPDLTQVIEDLAHQTYHVHCRVGYDHGPQVFFDLLKVPFFQKVRIIVQISQSPKKDIQKNYPELEI